ncbi:site-specific integrase [Pandoraea sputorum]|uniref:site-specific integrase n=1 Tax=Pandoraea sputorum TaxID=93222 RepID=UPI002F3FB51A
MGTIQKRTDNSGKVTYQAKIRRVGFPHKSKTFPTKAEAKAWLEQTESVLATPTQDSVQLATKYTFGDLMRRYAKEVSPTKKTGEAEAARLLTICRMPIAKYTVDNLTTQAFAEYRDERLKKVTGSTVNREFNVLHHVLEIARKEWGVSAGRNPLSDVRRPKHNPGRIRRLSPTEERDLLKACSESRGGYLRCIVELALETAMRQSELLKIDWKHIDIPNKRLFLPDTKNGTPRGVPLSRRAIELLQSRPTRYGLAFGDVSPEAVKRSYIRATRRANLDDLHFHDLRHEATSRFFEKGLSMMDVASITGHKTLSMLQRYTHLNATHVADKLDALSGHSTL